MKRFSLLALLVVLVGGAYLLGRRSSSPVPGSPADTAAASVYQCPMHPWIKADRTDAKCTVCGMALVAASASQGSGANEPVDPNLVTLTPAQATVVGVRTAPVLRGTLQRTLRVTGTIDDDETRHRILAARVPGRIESLQINAVGVEVEAGAPLATLYSPPMLTAQRTYVERLRSVGSFTASERAQARERLLELGLTDEEVRILEGTLQPTAIVNVRAPMSGTVVARSVYEGQYVEANDPLFELGDFSRMWFVFDAYEPDLAWIRPGQTVELSVPSRPGEVLTAPITFIDPNVDPMARTARVRVVLDNSSRSLLHRQTAQAVVRIETPEVILLPRSAVLQHGGSPMVFVAREGQRYAARPVRLGRVGDRDIEVLEGVAEGDRVVTEGGLLLDGQAQLAHAAIGGGGLHDGHASTGPTAVSIALPAHDAAARDALLQLALSAADAGAALAADDLQAYRAQVPGLRERLESYLAAFAPAARGALGAAPKQLADGPDLDAARRAFEPISTALADAVRGERLHTAGTLWIYQCPMTPVLGTGRWLARKPELRNPFFGSDMLECGEEVK